MSLLPRCRYVTRNLAGEHRATLGLLALRPGGRDEPLDADTQVCLEGFPRSGNTFATVLLRRRGIAQLSSHRHAPAQVERALRAGVPVVLVVRDPVEACASQLVGAPDLRPGDVLWAYRRFHDALVSRRDDVLVLSFETLTGDPAAVLHAVADHTGRELDTAPVDDEERTAIFHEIKWLSELDRRQGPEMAARPSERREALKETVRAGILGSPRLPAARAVWEQWRAAAV